MRTEKTIENSIDKSVAFCMNKEKFRLNANVQHHMYRNYIMHLIGTYFVTSYSLEKFSTQRGRDPEQSKPIWFLS